MKYSPLFSYIPFLSFRSSLKETYSLYRCGINDESTTTIKKRFRQISFLQLKSYDLKEFIKIVSYLSSVLVLRVLLWIRVFPLFPFQRIAYAAKCTCIRSRRRKNDKAKQVNRIVNDNNESFIAITTTKD